MFRSSANIRSRIGELLGLISAAAGKSKRASLAVLVAAFASLVWIAAAWGQTGTPTIGFTFTSIPVKEMAGTLYVEVSLSSQSTETVTVQYMTVDGSALAPDDYTSTSGTLTFPPGALIQSIPIGIVNDGVAESSEYFHVVLSNPVGATMGDDTCMVTIQDDDSAGPATVYFEFGTWTYNEFDGTASIIVLMTGTPSADVSVDFATSNGTAVAGSDYTAVSGTLTWSPSESGMAKSFTVSILDDSLVEGIETVNLTLSNPINATLGSQSTAILNIVDDESPCKP